jgi:hypothetical protein
MEQHANCKEASRLFPFYECLNIFVLNKNKMKNIIVTCLIFAALACSCNNSTKQDPEKLKAKSDSLYEEVMDGHNIGMAKQSRLKALKQHAQNMLDSISKLPAAAQSALSPYKSRLDSLIADLDNSWNGMEQWMDDFKIDSAENNLEQRIRYLADEKLRVGKVKDAILGSLAKADSLLKK